MNVNLHCELIFTSWVGFMKKLHTQVRQEQLAQATLALIAAHGIEGLSIARVARRVGLVPSAIYRHFSGKDQLVDAAVALIRERLHGNVSDVMEQTPDALERLRRLLLAHVSVIRGNEGILRVVFSDELHHGQPTRKARVLEMITSYLKGLADIAAEGQRKRQIRRDIDPSTIAVMFLGLIQPASILWHLSDGEFDVTRHVEKGWPIFKAAIQDS
jgi:AcrR family transcriptional regulator